MLRLGRQDIDIPAGDAGYIVTDRYTLPVDVEVQAVQPHAHYRARDVRGEATLPDVSSARLLLAGLVPGATFDLQLTSGFAPGAPVWRLTAQANDAGVLEAPWTGRNGRLRIQRIGGGR